jgi:hypothetical protein
MREQIEVIYENGAFHPVAPLPNRFREHQHYTLTIEDADGIGNWLEGADPNVRLEDVRQTLAKVSITISQAVEAERADR